MVPIGRRSFLTLLSAGSCGRRVPTNCQNEFRSARTLLRKGELALALERCNACLPLLVTAGRDDALRTEFRLLRAEILISQGKVTDALAQLDEISLPTLSGLGRSSYWMHRGYALSRLSRFEESKGLLLRAESLASSLNNPALLGEIALRRGTVEARTGDLRESGRLFRSALELAGIAQNRFLEAMALASLGRVYYRLGRYDEALDWFERAIKINGEIGSRNALAKDLNNRGLCYGRLGRNELARSSHREALKIHEAGGNPLDGQRALGNIGTAYYREGNLERARANYERALEAAKSLSEPESVVKWLRNLAMVSLDSSAIEDAERYNREALRSEHVVGDRRTRLALRIDSARIQEARGRVQQAESTYLETIRLAEDQPDKQLEALSRLGEMYFENGRLAEAKPQLDAALDVIDRARDKLQRAQSKISYLATLMRPYRAYVDLLMSLGRTEEAFEVADASRARTLAEKLDQPLMGRTQANILPAVSRLSADETVILSYWLAPRRSFLWAASRGGLTEFELPPRQEIESLVAGYQKRITGLLHDPIQTLDEGGRRLFDMLIGPVAHLIPPGARVILVPDGNLNSLNFESLLAPGSPPHYWIEDVTVLVTSSLHILLQSRPAPLRDENLLLIGDPDPASEDFPKLPAARREMDAVHDRWGPRRTVVRRGAQANVSAYQELKPGRFRLIHFAAHAEANPESPLDSAVILSRQDGRFKLYARDVLETPLRAQLVTLSACRSAGSAVYAGEGLVGLAWAFLRAGAGNVVGGLWNVADSSTAELMESLYAGLAAGKAPADALRAAKLALIATGGRHRKPFYWAPFQIHTTWPS